MKKEELNKIKQLLSDSNCIVMATDNGVFVYGGCNDVYSTIGSLIASIYQDKRTHKELLKKIIQAATAEEDELLDMLQEEFDKFKQKLKDKDNQDE